MTLEARQLIDLTAIIGRARLEEFLEETASFYASRLVILDLDLRVLSHANHGSVPPDVAALPVERVADELRLRSPRAKRVAAYDATIGCVVAEPVSPEDERAAIALATNVAALLSELASREYELNDLSQEILDSYEEVNLFYDISTALGSVRDVGGICRVILEKACEIIKVGRASILLTDEKTGDLFVASARGIPEEEWSEIRIPVGEGISGKVLESRTARLVDDVAGLPTGLLRGYEAYATRSFISVPLCVDRGRDGARGTSGLVSITDRAIYAGDRGKAIGVINMTDRIDRANFTSGDLKLLTALAGQAAVLIENIRLIELEKELRIARNIQKSLLPVAPPALAGLDLAGACVPARNVGGDYYDFIVREDSGQLFAAIADVSGHNVASALMMAVVRSALRAEIRRSGDPGTVLESLNGFLYEDLTRAELFLSIFCLVYETDSRRVRFANAGHHPALLYREVEGGCRALDADGLLAGVMDEMTYPEVETRLVVGDVLLLYTDGLIEAMDPSGLMFGMDRLAATLERCSELPAGILLNRVFEEVYAFSGESSQADDMTAVVLKVTEPGLR